MYWKQAQRTFWLLLAAVVLTFKSVHSQVCNDKEQSCSAWAQYCHNNDYVRDNCQATCHTCPRKQTTFAARKEQDKQRQNEQLKRNSVGDDVPVRRQQLLNAFDQSSCVDTDPNCEAWLRSAFSLCSTSAWVRQKCRRQCGFCRTLQGRSLVARKYDMNELPHELIPVGWLLGKWRSEHGGKAKFPTIPVFTYGEEIDFSIAEPPRFGARSLNYTAFAFGINEAKELHSEYGFLAVQNNSDAVALTTVMNNGFTTVEEGRAIGNTLRLKLRDIGRISFSRDLPVHDMVREFRLINSDTLEQHLEMETLTHPMQEHTAIRYKKVFP